MALRVPRGVLNRIRVRKSSPRSVAAPLGGLNTRDSLASMDSLDAYEMVNFFPGTGKLSVRKGFETHSVDMNEVFTVASYNNSKLLSATTTTIWDSTNAQSYFANAVDIQVAITSALTITDGKAGTLSVYIRPGSTAFRAFGHDRFSLEWTGTKLQLVGKNAAGTTILDVESSALTSGKWYNILVSWNLATPVARLYINNAEDLTTTTLTDDTIDYDFASYSVLGNVSELWFNPAYIDFSTSTNRDFFIDSSGRPVSLGSDGSTPGSQPLVYLSGSQTAFRSNKGSGEDFSGTTAKSLSSPSQKPVQLKTGFSSGKWQATNFNNRLFLANGTDTFQIYDGSTVADSTFTGPTLANIVGSNAFKSRLYVWEVDSQDFWYGSTNAIAGAMTRFPLSRVGNFGGNLVSMVNWTIDGGDGSDDFAVFLMSTGEAIVYQGSDPGDANAWSLVGVYRISSPLSYRSAVKVGGDVMIQTSEDYVLLSLILRENTRRTKMSGAAQDVARRYSANDGWGVTYYPTQGYVIFNIPVSSTRFDQHILNVVTRAWTSFQGMNARDWAVHDGDLYFAGVNGVFQADQGNSDNGVAIQADCKQAWNMLGSAGLKRITSYRPVMDSTGTLSFASSLSYDYKPASIDPPQSVASAGTPWGSPWGSPWSAVITVKQDWKTASGLGYEVSVRVSTRTLNQDVSWYRTDYVVERGGIVN